MASTVKWHKGIAACECGEETTLEYSSKGDFMIAKGWDRDAHDGGYLCGKCSRAIRGITSKLSGEPISRRHRKAPTTVSKEITMSGMFRCYVYGGRRTVKVSIKKLGGEYPYEIRPSALYSYSSVALRTNKAGLRKYIRALQRALTEL